MNLIPRDEINKIPVMLKVSEAAKLLNCSRKHIYLMIKEDKIPRVLVGDAIRIPRDQLLAVLKGKES